MAAEDDQTEIELWPETGEDREEFLDRCVEALIPCIGEDDAVDVCTAKWTELLDLGKKGFVTRSMLAGNAAIEPCGESCMGCKGRDAPYDPRQAILDQARETLRRTAHLTVSTKSVLPPDESLADRRYREAIERKAERDAEQQQQHRLTDYEAAQLEARVRAELAGTVAAERGFMMELLAEFLAHVERQTNEKVGLLRADMNVQRAVDREGSNVVDMPDFLTKRDAS